MAATNDEIADLFSEWRDAWTKLERFARKLGTRANLINLPARRYFTVLEYEKSCRLNHYQAGLLSELLKVQIQAEEKTPLAVTSSPGGRIAMSLREAANALGVSRSAIYGAVRREQIPSIRLGKRILVSRHALEDLFALPHGSPESEDDT